MMADATLLQPLTPQSDAISRNLILTIPHHPSKPQRYHNLTCRNLNSSKPHTSTTLPDPGAQLATLANPTVRQIAAAPPANIQAVLNAIQNLTLNFNQQFAEHNQLLAQLNQSVAEHNQQLAQLNQSVAGVQLQVQQMQQTLNGLDSKMNQNMAVVRTLPVSAGVG